MELDYTNTRSSQGSVDHEKGWRWNLVAAADQADGDTVPKLLEPSLSVAVETDASVSGSTSFS